MLFTILVIFYYVYYNSVTSKSSFANAYLLYTVYYSRLCNVKVAIYDKLYTNSMISYPFQNIIYDLFFFVPRKIWSAKPYGYYPYFTSYIFYGNGFNTNINYGFQVNIWSEYITNGGFIGYVISLFYVIMLASICEKSKNNLIYLIGTVYIILYMSYGFEHIVQIVYIMLVGLVILDFFVRHLKR